MWRFCHFDDMKVHTLKVNNFKSYKGVHSIGPFTEFTAVVGTNASGKSNCFDAVCFVLGASSKALRCKDLSELLYRGTENAKSGFVQMTIATEYGSKIKFKREISGNSCSYYVNKECVSRQKYKDQLNKCGFHQNFQSYILFQGEIGTMATMKPKALTQLIENLCGSIQMKDSYEKLEKDLNETSKQTKESFHLYEELSSKFDSLKDNIETVNSYRALISEKNQAELKLTNFLLYTNALLYNNKHAEINQLNFDIEKMNNDSKEIIEAINAQNSIIKTVKNALQQDEKKLKLANEKLSNLTSEVNIIAAEIKHKEENDKTLHEEEDQISEQYKQEENMKKQLSLEIENYEKENQHIIDNINQIRNFIQEYNNITFSSPEAMLKKQEYDKCLMMQNMAENNVKKATSQYESVNLLIKTTEHNHKNEFNQQIYEPDVEKHDTYVISKQNEKQILSKQLKDCEEKLSKINRNNSLNKKKLEENQAVQRLQNQFKGVHGFVRDLYRPVRIKYDIPIKSALGYHLNQIIVDSFNTAIGCIQYLKANNLGKYTFLPLDTIIQKLQQKGNYLKNAEHSFDINEIGPNIVVPHLLDFVECEEYIKPIFEYCLSQIYLCESQEKMDEIWATKKYKKLIDLEGTIIKSNGCITGGRIKEKHDSIQSYTLENLENERKNIIERMRRIEKEIKDKQDEFDSQLKSFMEYQNKKQIYLMKIQKLQEEMKNKEKEVNEKTTLLELAQERCLKAKQCLDEINMHDNNKKQESLQQLSEKYNHIFQIFNDITTIDQLILIEEEFSKKEKENAEKIAKFQYLENNSTKDRMKTKKDEIKENKKVIQALKKKYQERNENIQGLNRDEYQRIQNDVDQGRSNVHQAEEKKKEMIDNNKMIKKKINETRVIIQNKEKAISQLFNKLTDIFTHSTNEFDSIEEILNSNFAFIPKSEQQIAETMLDNNTNVNKTRSRSKSRQKVQKEDSFTNKTVSNYINQLKEKIASINNKISELGEPNFKAEEEAIKIKQKRKEAKHNAKALRDKQRVILNQFQDIKRRRKEKFLTALQNARNELALVYSTLTQSPTQPLGGTAFLSSEIDDLPFNGGTIFSVIPPHKKERQLNTLSGGEQTIAIVALAFALNKIAPAPIFVLDEIDSALDIKNVTKLAEFLDSQKSKQRQIIMISHKPNVFWLCQTLIGVTKRVETGSNTFRLSLQTTKKTIFKKKTHKKLDNNSDNDESVDETDINLPNDIENEENESENDEPPSIRIAGI